MAWRRPGTNLRCDFAPMALLFLSILGFACRSRRLADKPFHRRTIILPMIRARGIIKRECLCCCLFVAPGLVLGPGGAMVYSVSAPFRGRLVSSSAACQALGNRAHTFKAKAMSRDGKVDWSKGGCFRLTWGERDIATEIKHDSGAVYKPEIHQVITKVFHLDRPVPRRELHREAWLDRAPALQLFPGGRRAEPTPLGEEVRRIEALGGEGDYRHQAGAGCSGEGGCEGLQRHIERGAESQDPGGHPESEGHRCGSPAQAGPHLGA